MAQLVWCRTRIRQAGSSILGDNHEVFSPHTPLDGATSIYGKKKEGKEQHTGMPSSGRPQHHMVLKEMEWQNLVRKSCATEEREAEERKAEERESHPSKEELWT